MEPKQFRFRLITLGGLFALCLIVFLIAMFDAQIVHGSDYRIQSVRTNTNVETVEASRGIVIDRNGKVLVSNLPIYTLTFDASLVDDAALNDELLRLISLLRARGVVWDDLLPLTREAPYDYDFSLARSSTLLNYMAARGWIGDGEFTEDELPRKFAAPFLIARLRDEYGIDHALTATDTRALVGFRYSLAVSDRSFVFASDVDVALISIVKDGDYAGVRVGQSSKRIYETDAAAHILGRVGKIQNWDDYKGKGYARNDLVGLDGVELAFESYLRGTDGRRIVTTNTEGKVTSELYSVEPQPGGTLALTLDIDFQEDVERILAESVGALTEEDGVGRGAAAVAVQVGTGEVLASASYPTYSLANFQRDFAALNVDPLTPMLNRATQGRYAPGSTFKPVTAVAALETGVITPQTRIRDLGQYVYYDRVYNCWIYSNSRRTHGLINVTEAITVSCNYFFYDVGRMTGIATLDRYAAAFGLGEPTGIEITEYTGAMTSPDYVNSLPGLHWTDGLTLQAAIGQANSVFTPLQLANYIATLVGGGARHAAHLEKEVRDANTHALIHKYDETPVETVSIEPQNLRSVMNGMRNLVVSGSISEYFDGCVVEAAAKTGTAQTGGEQSNSVFVCYAPYDDPQIAVALVIEKGGAGKTLATTAVEILNSYFTTADLADSVIGENILLK